MSAHISSLAARFSALVLAKTFASSLIRAAARRAALLAIRIASALEPRACAETFCPSARGAVYAAVCPPDSAERAIAEDEDDEVDDGVVAADEEAWELAL